MTILEMSAAGGLLILAILALRRLALYRLPKITFLILWGVALCRLLIPFSIPSSLSVYTALGALEGEETVLSAPPAELSAPPSAAPEWAPDMTSPVLEPAFEAGPSAPEEGNAPSAGLEAAPQLSVSPWIAIHLAGALVCAAFFVGNYVRCLRRFRTALPVDEPALAEWLRAYPRVSVRQSDQIQAPLTYGLIRPVILLPKGMDWTDREGLRYVLVHEWIHVRRGDLWGKLALAAALCLHWFNPLVWIMYLRANQDMELACDEAVLRVLGAEMRGGYALSLIRWEESRSPALPLCGSFSGSRMEERITAIMRLKKRSLAGILAAAVLVAGMTVLFTTSRQEEPPAVISPPSQSGEEDTPSRLEPPVKELTPPEPVSLVPEKEPVVEEKNRELVPAQPTVEPEKAAPVRVSRYPVNSKGQTYGVWAAADGYEDIPDLIYCRLDQVTWGYLSREELCPFPDVPSSEEEIARYLDWYQEKGSTEPGYSAASIWGIQLHTQEGEASRGYAYVYISPCNLSGEQLREDLAQGTVIRPALLPYTAPAEVIPTGRRLISGACLDEEDEYQRALMERYTEDGDWKRNSQGETYGDPYIIGVVGYYPDWMAETATNGQSGYISYEDYKWCGYSGSKDREDLDEYYVWLKEQPGVLVVPVYDLEGTVVGMYEMGNGSSSRWNQIVSEPQKWNMLAAILKQRGYTQDELLEIQERIMV